MFLKICIISLLIFSFSNVVFAEEITLVLSGQSHAMLYPCRCPNEPDGGIARRGSLIKKLRKETPNMLVLEAGAFFAGGVFDEYTQVQELDKERSKINLKAMELIGYDCVGVGADEFNFGKEFFQETIANTKLPFVSANIEGTGISPWVIKTMQDATSGKYLKAGITSLTSMLVEQKISGLKASEPKLALKKAVLELREKGADIVILLSNLSEEENSVLIKENPGIDVLVSNNRSKEQSFNTIDSVLVLRTDWQARRLTKAALFLKDKKIVDSKVEQLRLSEDIVDDRDILRILPCCFQDTNCKKTAMYGVCKNPGSLNARCDFSPANKIPLLIITPKFCRTCETEKMVQFFHRELPGLAVSYLFYPNNKAEKIIKDLGIKALPAFLFSKVIEKEKFFENFKQNLEQKGDFYKVRPQISGFGYFLNRPLIDGRIDLFISLSSPDLPTLLDNIKEFNPHIHFLVKEERQDSFLVNGGLADIEENLRSVCVARYYPGYFWQYISCRAKNLESSYWDDCLPEKIDAKLVKDCAKGEEGKNLLRENIRLNKELEIMEGPTYLLGNQEIFASVKAPAKEEFRKLFKK